ncbi:MAG: hypothetical protein RBR41_00465 [Desulfovibrio sp.]|uniref:hypothetical protein n=1 Tax=Desulfovibrio sp. TaxID=885 RepID=UPI002A36CCBD|nr:hypothetical protein [Desulfovibrio sp.]MDY0258125.1 hypothetical protein [Desulfovibrio sp.]
MPPENAAAPRGEARALNPARQARPVIFAKNALRSGAKEHVPVDADILRRSVLEQSMIEVIYALSV